MLTSPRILIPLPLAFLLAVSCSPETTQPSTPSGSDQASATAIEPAATSDLPPFDPDNFVSGVDNPLFPLPLGRRLVYRGSDEGEPVVDITDITRDKKTILGVHVVTVLDRLFQDGQLTEKTFDWYAQDREGNVWYMGEDTKELENGRVVSTAGSFEAGKNGARAGIIMRAHPKLFQITPQEDAPGVAEDKARVIDLDQVVTLLGTRRHCIKTAEFTDLEPDALEYKLYCRGLGIVRERDVRGGSSHDHLVKVVSR